MKIINVPIKGSDISIKCRLNINKDYIVLDSHAVNICIISGHDTAHDIAEALTIMRDIGFEQGRRYVRDALFGEMPYLVKEAE